MRNCYGDRSREGPQDEKETSQECEPDEGTGESPARQEGQKGLEACKSGGGFEKSLQLDLDLLFGNSRHDFLYHLTHVIIDGVANDAVGELFRLHHRCFPDLVLNLPLNRLEMVAHGFRDCVLEDLILFTHHLLDVLPHQRTGDIDDAVTDNRFKLWHLAGQNPWQFLY